MTPCQNCIYFATIQIFDHKPTYRCSLKEIKLKSKGMRHCLCQRPLRLK